MDNIQSSIDELTRILKSKCPLFQPAIFPSYMDKDDLNKLNAVDSVSQSRSTVDLAYLTDVDYTLREIKIYGLRVSNTVSSLIYIYEVYQ